MIPKAVVLLTCLAALASKDVEQKHYHKLPGIADYDLISAYEDLVAVITNNIPLGLKDLPKRMILFSTWYIASRSLHSALAGGECSCQEEFPESLQPFVRGRVCKLDPDAVETISPFLFGDQVPSPDLTPPQLWAQVAKRSMYIAEISRTYAGVTAEPAFQASMLSLSHLAASLPELLASDVQ